MHDPRISIIEERLKDINKIVVVASGKGGVGKSLIASMLALALSKKGFKTGLFDIDFTSPTTHIVLGISNLQPKEDKGIIPPEIHGVKYMSLIFYISKQAAPLRGPDLSNVLIELLAITRWGKLDFLIIDTPPGISDLLLDTLKYINEACFLIVTTPSKMAFETVRRLLILLDGLGADVLGVIENMRIKKTRYIEDEVKLLGKRFLGAIHFDNEIEDSLGNINTLLKTRFMKELEDIIIKNQAIFY